jgi:hypothetical protein
MSPEARRGRPGQETPSIKIAKTSLLPGADNPLDDIAAHVDGAFVLVVRVTGGRYRRRCFLSVASAEKAASRATENGHDAEVYLAELKPLWRLTGGHGPDLFTDPGGTQPR